MNAYLCGVMKRPALVIFLFTVFLLCGDAQAQCAMCREAAEATMKDNPGSMARNLNRGILYLMAVPYLAIAFIFRKQLAEVGKRLWNQIARKVRGARQYKEV